MKGRISLIVFFSFVLLTSSVLAQKNSSDSWSNAQSEMKAMFGSVPVMFTKLPMHLRVTAWEWFKSTSDPDAAIPPKYGELVGLAVAAQIPCNYCIYAHTTMAKMYGATEQEIQEAVTKGAEVRHWSTVLNGNQVDYEAFKSEWDNILKFIAANKK